MSRLRAGFPALPVRTDRPAREPRSRRHWRSTTVARIERGISHGASRSIIRLVQTGLGYRGVGTLSPDRIWHSSIRQNSLEAPARCPSHKHCVGDGASYGRIEDSRQLLSQLAAFSDHLGQHRNVAQRGLRRLEHLDERKQVSGLLIWQATDAVARHRHG